MIKNLTTSRTGVMTNQHALQYNQNHQLFLPIIISMSSINRFTPYIHAMPTTSRMAIISNPHVAAYESSRFSQYIPASVQHGMPSKKRTADDRKVIKPLFDRNFPGYKSISDVIMASIVVNCESRPRVKSIMKNRSAHKGETGSLVMASGYATNARPNPGKKIYDFIFLF